VCTPVCCQPTCCTSSWKTSFCQRLANLSSQCCEGGE
jgi:hypothetical protein